MKALLKLWSWFDEKKTIIGAALLFLDGGLNGLGYDIPGLKELGMAFAGSGLAHKVIKR